MIREPKILFVLLASLMLSCRQGTSDSFEDFAKLLPADTVCFLLDDSTYYESKAMFQFEDKGKEYLFFQNNRNRGTLRILIFDIEKEELYKSVPLYAEGPNGIPSILGGWPLDMKHFVVTTNSPNFYI